MVVEVLKKNLKSEGPAENSGQGLGSSGDENTPFIFSENSKVQINKHKHQKNTIRTTNDEITKSC